MMRIISSFAMLLVVLAATLSSGPSSFALACNNIPHCCDDAPITDYCFWVYEPEFEARVDAAKKERKDCRRRSGIQGRYKCQYAYNDDLEAAEEWFEDAVAQGKEDNTCCY